MRFNLHIAVEPFSNILQKFIALSKLSKWRKQTPVHHYNDFYKKSYDYEQRYVVYQIIAEKYGLDTDPINFIEFGVEEGNSLKWWIEKNVNQESLFFGLDTFEGLPEDWGSFKKGSMQFSIDKVIINDERVRLIKGLIQNTVNETLLKLRPSSRTVYHMDADLFSSTLVALTQSFRFFKAGDLILFDEFSTPTHEFWAFKLFSESFYLKYEVVVAACNFSFLVIEIK